MQLLGLRALFGPNVWGRASVIEARLVLPGTLPDNAAAAACERRLLAWLPGWSPRHPSAAHPRIRVADAVQSVARELQSQVGPSGSAGSNLVPLPGDDLEIAVEFQEERLARACLEAALSLCEAALLDRAVDVPSEIARLRALAEDVCLGRATGPLVAAARARGIPYRRLDDESLVQLGHGAVRRRIRTSVTECTGKLAEGISLDKELTKRLLVEVGIPVPVGRRVQSAEEAWVAACALGLPVAIKPASADYGHGIGLNLQTREQVEAAYAAAREYREEILVERFATGQQYRVTVVAGRVVAAVRREPVQLTGNGEHSIKQLMEIANRDPRRGDDLRLPLTKVDLDDDTPQILAEQGFDLDSVVPQGRQVVLSRIAHSWAGAGVCDVTDLVHSRVAAQCVRAARLIGLDVAGLDIVAEDIARPLEDQGGVILEVNAEPTIAFHFPPLCDTHRPVCEAIIESLFPQGQTGRIPLALVSGPGSRAEVGRLLAKLLGAAGRGPGRASSEGLFLGEDLIKSGPHASLAGTLAALVCPECESAVLERDLAGIREQGLGVDQVDVAVLCFAGARCEVEQMRAARVLVDVAQHVVIDARDHASLTLLASFPGKAIVVGTGSAHEASVTVRDGALLFRSRSGEEQVLPLGQAASDVCVYAAAAAWALGVPLPSIGTALKSPLRDPGA